MSHATATKTAAKKPAKKKVSAFSTRKVDPAYYWMVVPAAIIFAFFLYLPFLDGIKYSFTNSQGYGDYKFIGLKNYIALFQEDKATGHRQQRQLIGGQEVLTQTAANHQRTAGARSNHALWIARINHHRAIGSVQLT